MTEQDRSLYKFAEIGLRKKAAEGDFKVSLSDDAKAALFGALAGGGLGVVTHAMTPSDEDEDRKSRLLSHVLAGAAMGGLAGYGGKKVYDSVKSDPVEPDPWVERNLDPDLSTVLAGTSAVSGGVAAKKLYNKTLLHLGDNTGSSVLFGTNGKAIPYKDLSTSEKSVFDAYRKAKDGRILRLFTPRGRREQRTLENALNKAVAAARSRGTRGGVPKVPSGFLHNQRRMIDAFKGSRGLKPALTTAAATGLAALIIKSLGKEQQ